MNRLLFGVPVVAATIIVAAAQAPARADDDATRARDQGCLNCHHVGPQPSRQPSAQHLGDKLRRREMFETGDARNKRPFTLDGCHAWRSDGPVVERYMPMWYRPHKQAASEEESSVSRKEPS